MNEVFTAYLQPHQIDKNPSFEPEDVRLRHVIGTEITSKTTFVLIGFPFDKGVRINGGRPGARFAPNAIRQILYNFVADSTLDYSHFADIGNVNIEDDSIEQAQKKLGLVVETCFKLGVFPIVLGGGHETSFGHFLGYVSDQNPLQIVNFDAHTDVRVLKNGLAHSGSPFFQIAEHESNLLKKYEVIGAQIQSVSTLHSDRVREMGQIQFIHNPIKPAFLEYSTILTIDLDVFHQSIMPGVSAPNANGFLFDDFWQLVKPLLQSEKLKSIDLVELNPLVDINQAGTRFTAFVLWKIIHELILR